MTKSSSKTTRRALPKEVRRQQLVLATIKCIARSGLSSTTMAMVTQEAGLSLGIANLHFESKDKLLIATLEHVTGEYNSGQEAILKSDKHPSTAEKIEALLQFDFSPKVTQKNKMAVWFAFWGEAKSRPTYQNICANSDYKSEDAIRDLFQQAVDEGGYSNANVALLASGYTALIDGLWLDLLVAPRRMNRTKARLIARHYLASAFPNHLTPEPD